MGEEEIGVSLKCEMTFLQCLGDFYVRKGDLEEICNMSIFDG